MPSVGMQMPKLFLRGSLCSNVMVNLDDEQIQELSVIVEDIINEPLLKPTRIEFASALGRTIKCDYLDRDAADQEFKIAIWKAAAAAKFGWGSHEPNEAVLTDKSQMKKYFQTWAFNYLKQILNENKRPSRKTIVEKHVPIIDICKDKIINNLNNFSENGYCIFCDMFMIPSRNIDKIAEIKKVYFNKGIDVVVEHDKITIKNLNNSMEYDMIQVEERTSINTISTSTSDDDDKKGIQLASPTELFKDPDLIKHFFENLSEDAKNVFNLIVNPPEDFIEKYGEKPVKKYLTEYLNLTPKQTKEIWFELRMIYCDTIGTPT